MNGDPLTEQFQCIEDDFNEAPATDNIEKISKFLSSNWFLLEPQFGIISKERFINSIESGDLSHTEMRKKVLRVTLHNNIALVISRGMNIGFYKENRFNSEQWVANIYKKENENWICIMTQEAPVSCK